MKCCKLLAGCVMERVPFERTIASGFYDGRTDGFTECSQCKKAYSFRKLDWDDSQNVRIFGFAPLESELDAIAARLGVATPSRERLTGERGHSLGDPFCNITFTVLDSEASHQTSAGMPSGIAGPGGRMSFV